MHRTVKRHRSQTVSVFLALFLLSAMYVLAVPATGLAATDVAEPSHDPQPPKVKLGEFADIQMKAVGIDEQFASHEANQKALKKVDELLFQKMQTVFPTLKRVEAGSDFSKSEGRGLRIIPVIKQIKFIGGAARFWVGPMAGNSAILMQLTIKDSTTDEIIADEQFYRRANAFAGASTIGAMDNVMLNLITSDIAKYCADNK